MTAAKNDGRTPESRYTARRIARGDRLKRVWMSPETQADALVLQVKFGWNQERVVSAAIAYMAYVSSIP